MTEFCRVDLSTNECFQQTEPSVQQIGPDFTKLKPWNLISAEDFVQFARNCSKFWLSICSPVNSSYLSFHQHSLRDRNNNNYEESNCFADFEFVRNKDLLGEKLRNDALRPNDFKECDHFEDVNAVGQHSSLSVCSAHSIFGIVHIEGKMYQLQYTAEENTFLMHSFGATNFYLSSCDALYARLKRTRRRRRAISAEDDARHAADTPRLPHYYAEYLNDVRRYVELIFIADNSVYVKYEKNAAKIHERLQAIAGIVNSLYAPLNIRVTLVWADIWMGSDAVEVSFQADRTLARFVAYRKSQLLVEHPHDNAHLITDVRFGEVIGKAYRGTMCSYDYSGGVIVDHSPHVAFVGGTVAHEMGHNFGMDHDSGYPLPCACAAHQCIMAPASSSINASTYFSDCSLKALDAALKRGVDYCLRNVPETVFGDAKCGNGVLEPGEECDCGSTKACPNRCCIAATCQLTDKAQCADGECCDVETCKPKQAAIMCRGATNSCDLPEFCDGRNPVCPPDFFVQNGLQCPDDTDGFCYDGHCGSRDQQCRLIWGPSGRNSVDQCYAYNREGTFGGDCGYDPHINRYIPCRDDDVQCGRLQCHHEAEKPTFGDPSAVFSAYNFVRLSDGREATCRFVRTTYTGSGGRSHKMRDPGMVPDGARCGDGKMCIDAQCRNHSSVTQMVTFCEPPNCNGKGVCNNVGNCHCVPGYGGPGCDIPGYGGSLNSGPATDKMFNPGLVLAYLLLVGLIVFAFATYYCRRRHGRDYWLHKEIWRIVRHTLNIQSNVRVPIRRAPPVPNVTIHHTHRFSFNALWGDSTAAKNAQTPAPAVGAQYYTTAQPTADGVVSAITSKHLAHAHSSTSALLDVASSPPPSTASVQSIATGGRIPSSYNSSSDAKNPVVLYSNHHGQSLAVAVVDPLRHSPTTQETTNIWKNPLRKNEDRNLAAISPSNSSLSSNERTDVSERKPLKPVPANSIVSNRKLMAEIKRSIDNPSAHTSQSCDVLFADGNDGRKNMERMVESGGNSVFASALSYDKVSEEEKMHPPPLPPHRSRVVSNDKNSQKTSFTEALQQPPPTPKKPHKPRLAIVPNAVKPEGYQHEKGSSVAARLAHFESAVSGKKKVDSSLESSTKSDECVRQLTARFDK